MVIDVRGPQGNVLVILGFARQTAGQMRSLGDPESAGAIEMIVKNAARMKYDAILDALESAAPGIFKFTGRARSVDEDDPDHDNAEDEEDDDEE